MHIPFPCPNKLSGMKSTPQGFYCGDCKKHLIDTRFSNSPEPENGDCVITNSSQEKYEFRNKTFRFALALFIAMASSIIVNNNVHASQLIDHLETLREHCVNDSAIYFNGNISDEKGRSIQPVKVTVVLDETGKSVEARFRSSRRSSTYSFEVPAEYFGKTVTVEMVYFDQVKKIQIEITDKEYQEISETSFKRNKKDRYTKKRYPKVRYFIGKFKF